MARKRRTMDCGEAGRKRWRGVTAEERTALMRAAVLKRWQRVREEQARAAEDEARAS